MPFNVSFAQHILIGVQIPNAKGSSEKGASCSRYQAGCGSKAPKKT